MQHFHTDTANTTPPVVAPFARVDKRRTSKAISLVVPIGVLLLLQWPLRAWVESFSNFTSNLTQVLFGLYTAFAITAASRSGSHLAFVKYGGKPANDRMLPWRAWVRLACIAPWAALILWTSVPETLSSLINLERFREGGFTHGYFLLRMAVVVLTALVLTNAMADVYFTRLRWRQQHAQA